MTRTDVHTCTASSSNPHVLVKFYNLRDLQNPATTCSHRLRGLHDTSKILNLSCKEAPFLRGLKELVKLDSSQLTLLVGVKIDGVEVASEVKKRVKKAVEDLKLQGINPCLATVLVGENQASMTYVRNKQKACADVGILTKDHKLPETLTQSEMNSLVDSLNSDSSIHGILIQLPLPKQLDEFETTSRIIPIKDVDGLTPQNVGLLVMKKSLLRACTPSGILELLDYYKIEMEGKNIVIINRSNLVGKPLFHLLLEKNATVTMCHSRTKNLQDLCRQADIIITGVGDRSKFTLTTDFIKNGAVIIDVAITRLNGKLVGDCDFEKIIQKASFASPVPGGVGPMTIAMLLKNTVTAASLSASFGKK